MLSDTSFPIPPSGIVSRSGSTGAAAGTTIPRQRSQYPKSRTHSAPILAHTSHLADPGSSSDDDDDFTSPQNPPFDPVDEVDPLDELENELDITEDPFFQQCTFLSSSIIPQHERAPSRNRSGSHQSGHALPPDLALTRTSSGYSALVPDPPVIRTRPGRATGASASPSIQHPDLSWTCDSNDDLSPTALVDTKSNPALNGGNPVSLEQRTAYSSRPESPDERLSPKSRPRIPLVPHLDSKTEPGTPPISPFLPFPAQVHPTRDVNIVVIGERGVGKSTFIQKALGFRNFSNSAAVTSKIKIHEETYNVLLMELCMASYGIDEKERIIWPDLADGMPVPPIHGVLVVYDVMSKASLEEIPDLLIALNKSGVQFILVPSKCDCHPALREIDPEVIRSRAQDLLKAEVVSCPISISSPGTYRSSLDELLSRVISNRRDSFSTSLIDALFGNGQHRATASRRRANSAASSLAPAANSNLKHARANSECSGSLFREHGMPPCTPSGFREQSFLNLEDSPERESAHSAVQRSMGIRAPLGAGTFADTDVRFDADTPISPRGQSINNSRLPPGSNSSPPHAPTFDQLVDHLLGLPLGRGDEKFRCIFLCLYRFFAAPSVLLKAVIDRFDFLEGVDCSSPQASDVTSSNMLLRGISQQRYISVLQTWISKYPGDFAHPLSRNMLSDFLYRISDPSTEVGCFHMVAAQMLIADLEAVQPDVDTDWACCDSKLVPVRNGSESSLSVSTAPTPTFLDHPSSSSLNLRKPSIVSNSNHLMDGISKQMSCVSLSSTDSGSMLRLSHVQSSGPPERKQSSFGGISRKSSNAVSHLSLESKSTANSLFYCGYPFPIAVPRFNLNKTHWNIFMSTPEEVIAQEFTQIAWQMFSYVRPRDIIRHVTMSRDDRETVKSLEQSLMASAEGTTRSSMSFLNSPAWTSHQGVLAVDMLTAHFNRVGDFTVNIILMRDKLRHRVIALTKMVRLARKLRILNNYLSLGAVLAALKATPIHRLHQTWDLIGRDVAMDFQRLDVLMSTNRSYGSYRLAWANTAKGKIPFIPMHRRDLVVSEAGGKTWMDENDDYQITMVEPGRPARLVSPPSKEESGWSAGVPGRRWINWRKFEIMGEAALSLERARERPYLQEAEGGRNDDIRSILMESNLPIADDLRNRSEEVEPTANPLGTSISHVVPDLDRPTEKENAAPPASVSSSSTTATSNTGLGGISLSLGGLGFRSLNSASNAAPTAAGGGGHDPTSASTPNEATSTQSSSKKFNWFMRDRNHASNSNRNGG